VPLFGTFELTPLCNLDCKMCYVHLGKDQLNGASLLTVDQWKDLMQQAVRGGMMYARLTGGECLTYPGFRELYLFLQAHGVEVSILSNGLLLNEEMIQFLLQHPPAAIQVTLYGASDEGYEAVTGHRVFSRVAENLHRIKASGIPLAVAVTPNAYMRDGDDIIRYLHQGGYTSLINAGLMAPRDETGRSLTGDGLEQYVSMLKLRRSLAGHETVVDCDPESLPDPGSAHAKAEKGVRCGAGRSGFSIDWKGGMRPCNTFPCEPLDVLELGFDEAWKRTNHMANNYPLPIECTECTYKDVCKHCVAEHAAGAPCGHANPSSCVWIKRMIAEGLITLQSP